MFNNQIWTVTIKVIVYGSSDFIKNFFMKTSLKDMKMIILNSKI
jgi:hypothetical protein